MNWIAAFELIASGATAAGVLIAAYQLRLTKQQALTQFEDEVNRQYREIARRLPVKAFLGEDLDAEEFGRALDEFFYYIDLCNEQVFLRRNGRVRWDTWVNWRDGIQSNLALPAFRRAWEEIKGRSESFDHLRMLEKDGFRTDPASWSDDHLSTLKQSSPSRLPLTRPVSVRGTPGE
jgi:hypothetical protein